MKQLYFQSGCTTDYCQPCMRLLQHGIPESYTLGNCNREGNMGVSPDWKPPFHMASFCSYFLFLSHWVNTIPLTPDQHHPTSNGPHVAHLSLPLVQGDVSMQTIKWGRRFESIALPTPPPLLSHKLVFWGGVVPGPVAQPSPLKPSFVFYCTQTCAESTHMYLWITACRLVSVTRAVRHCGKSHGEDWGEGGPKWWGIPRTWVWQVDFSISMPLGSSARWEHRARWCQSAHHHSLRNALKHCPQT